VILRVENGRIVTPKKPTEAREVHAGEPSRAD
jgi:hypothetical protein